jgi:tripartite-type tricarboxylate transporter receptor subunit TctC
LTGTPDGPFPSFTEPAIVPAHAAVIWGSAMTRIVAFALAAVALLCASPAVRAADYPTRPVTLVLGFAPGGPSDVVARIFGKKLEQVIGQAVVIDNRAGAGGNVAAELVVRAAPDGYTLLLGNSGILAANASLFKKINYEPAKDFAPITLVGEQPNVIYVHPSVPARSLAELIAFAKVNAGKINYATGGHGTSPHLAGELLKTEAKIEIVHVPYRGTGPALQDVLAGHVQMGISSIAPIGPHVQSGALRPLAVTGLKRTALLPNIPTIAELEIPGFEATSWHGLVAPAGTPKDVIATLHRAMMTTLNDPETRKSLTDVGLDVLGSTPDELAAYIRSEIPKWAAIVKASGATLE